MTEILTTRAIVLTLLDFKERHKIITLFSESEGIIKLFVTLNKKNLSMRNALLTPLTTGEFQISKGRSQFYRFHDGSLLNQRIGLRTELIYLETAQQLVKVFCNTQWPEQPSPDLFHILDSFLSFIPTLDHPERLLPIFYIKLLKHEGVLQKEPLCATCGAKSTTRYKGECYCEKDAPPPALSFSEEEESILRQMIESRTMHKLLELASFPLFAEKIHRLFSQIFPIRAYSTLKL